MNIMPYLLLQYDVLQLLAPYLLGMPRKFSIVKRFTTKLSTQSKWDTDTILKLNSNVIKWYTVGFNNVFKYFNLNTVPCKVLLSKKITDKNLQYIINCKLYSRPLNNPV